MEDGFIGRWSRRKLQAKQALEEQSTLPDGPAQAPENTLPATLETSRTQTDEAVAEVLPTEADLEKVKEGGDVIAFMSNKVSTELKNKAFKALFSRPEFNVMDGLDIYIDDYNTFVPLTAAEIDKMALSKQLLARPDLEELEKKLAEQAKQSAASLLEDEGEEGQAGAEQITDEPPVADDSTGTAVQEDLSMLGHEQNLTLNPEKDALEVRENPSKASPGGAS